MFATFINKIEKQKHIIINFCILVNKYRKNGIFRAVMVD